MTERRQWKVVRRVATRTGQAGKTEAVAGPFANETEAMRWIVQHPELGAALAVEPIVMPRRADGETP